MVRHPVDRIRSVYTYLRQSPEHGQFSSVIDRDFEAFVKEPNHHHNFTSFVLGEGDIARARGNLERDFPVVGVTDMFDESVLLFSQYFRWPMWPVYRRQNLSRHPESVKLTPRIEQEIVDRNEGDLKLYEYCRYKVQHDLDAVDPEGAKLSRFRVMQRLAQPILIPEQCLRTVRRRHKRSETKHA